MLLKEILLLELNIEPNGLKRLDQWIEDLEIDFSHIMPNVNHDKFLNRLKKDIVNDQLGMGISDIVAKYKPTDDDPPFIKNASADVYTIYRNEDDIPKDVQKGVASYNMAIPFKSDPEYENWVDIRLPIRYGFNLAKLQDAIHQRLLIARSGNDGARDVQSKMVSMYNISQSPDRISGTPEQGAQESKDALKIMKKYEQGKFNLEDLYNVIEEYHDGGPLWKRDPVERARLEKEAPIIMKFPDGFMWVRLDSKEEFEHESGMLGNCLHGYCPPQEAPTGKGSGESRDAVYQAWKDAGKPMDKEALKFEKDGGHILDYWWWNDQEHAPGISEPLSPNIRRLMKWVNETKAKLYPDVVEMEPGWFAEDQPHGWKYGVDMDNHTFTKYENVDHYIAHHIINWEYLAADPADPEHEPDQWDHGEIPSTAGGHLVYSLRDKNGESHAAIEYDRHKKTPDQLELKGKQNEEPDQKYMKYVDALDKYWEEHPEDFGVKVTTDKFDSEEDTEESIERLKHLAGI